MAQAPRDSRVFVNCPFDSRYIGILHAIIFAIHDLGFQARHALIDDSEPIRLKRISDELGACRYSIHDLSRVEVGGLLKLPRFNMPFEAGLAYAAHRSGTPHRPHHLFLVAKSQRQGLPGAERIAKRHALFFGKLPRLAQANFLKLREVKSLDYVNDLQTLMARWITENRP